MRVYIYELLVVAALSLCGCQALQVASSELYPEPSSNISYLSAEVEYLSKLRPRLTGSQNQNTLIDHIETELQQLGITVHTDSLNFTYFDLLSQPSLSVGSSQVNVTSYSKYSGFSGPGGVSGPLIDLTAEGQPVRDWSVAKDGIALTTLTNGAEGSGPEWSGSPPFPPLPGSPDDSATTPLANLSTAAAAGVKGVLVAWQNLTTSLANGQWSPIRNLFQGVPTLFVQGGYGGLENLQGLSKQNATAHVTLDATMVPNTPTRTLWAVFEGTEIRNESFLINTHTDGTNVIEENGWIALLAYAAHLKAHPPRRTTVMVFAGQHLQSATFAALPGKALTRWLEDHLDYWAGSGDRQAFQYGGQLKAVAATSVEHLGAVLWMENLANNTYLATNFTQPENLYASTKQLDQLLQNHWNGADPNVTRVLNPVTKGVQGGEGEALFLAGIPEISLVTNPAYLVKIWPEAFDERQLVDLQAMQRQVNSFLTIWGLMDNMTAEDFGMAPAGITL